MNSCGYLYVSSGGTANETTVNSEGYLRVSSGGTANSTTVNYGGDLHVSSGGTANSTTVNSGGSMFITVGGAANNVLVSGSLSVSSGGTAFGVAVTPWNGFLFVAEGAEITYSNPWSGVYFTSGGQVLSSAMIAQNEALTGNCSVYVMSDGSASSISVGAVGLYIYDGGHATAVDVTRGGYFGIFGGYADSVAINDGSMWLSQGYASDVTLNGGGLFIYSGGLAENVTFNDGATLHVYSGGTATISYNPWQQNHYEYGGGDYIYLERDNACYYGKSSSLMSRSDRFDGLTVDDACSALVYSGGVVESAAVSGGMILVFDGGSVDGVVLNSRGLLYVSSGGEASSTVINQRGTAHVSSGGSINSTTVSGGILFVSSGGFADKALVSNGMLSIQSGGMANDICIDGDFASMFVLKNAAVSSATLAAGKVEIRSGGTAADMTVERGVVIVSSGGKVTGELNITSGAVVSAYAGSVLDFDVSTVAAGDAALVNDLSLIQGAPDYTITVSATQATGNYALADGAAAFDKTVTVNTDAGTELGTITVGGELSAGGYTYTLNLAADQLSLTVASGAPVVEKPTRGDFNGNGISDILFQNLVDPMNPLGAWMDADMWQWNGALGPAAKTDWTVYGAFDFTGDKVCDIMFRSKLAATEYAVGFYDMGEGGTFKTMGWGVTAEWELAQCGDFNGNGVADILWSNTNTGYHGLWLDGTDQWVALPYSYLTPGAQKVYGVGDVNNDGCDDILINSNGTLGAWDIAGVIAGTESAPVWTGFGISLTSEWETVGAADFDGNGTADTVVWNKNSGLVGAYMNNDLNQWAGIFPSASPDEWGIPGFGDYNGDGCDDVLVRNLASGALGYWSGKDNFAWNGIGWGVDSSWGVIA